jgi:hypothetical protein
MMATQLLEENPAPTDDQIKNYSQEIHVDVQRIPRSLPQSALLRKSGSWRLIAVLNNR